MSLTSFSRYQGGGRTPVVLDAHRGWSVVVLVDVLGMGRVDGTKAAHFSSLLFSFLPDPCRPRQPKQSRGPSS
jgi:hypothetical protein